MLTIGFQHVIMLTVTVLMEKIFIMLGPKAMVYRFTLEKVTLLMLLLLGGMKPLISTLPLIPVLLIRSVVTTLKLFGQTV